MIEDRFWGGGGYWVSGLRPWALVLGLVEAVGINFVPYVWV